MTRRPPPGSRAGADAYVRAGATVRTDACAQAGRPRPYGDARPAARYSACGNVLKRRFGSYWALILVRRSAAAP